VETAFVPERVRLDPDLRVWRRLDATELSPILRQWIIASRPRVAIASKAAETAAREVAGAFFENDPEVVPPASIKGSREPVLISGLDADVDATLAKLGAAPRPQTLAGRGSAQAWTVAASAGTPPLAVLSAKDGESLRAMLRALPHLGAQSWLVFDGARVVDRGVWPARGRVVEVTRVQP
jgi:hypothetical protein